MLEYSGLGIRIFTALTRISSPRSPSEFQQTLLIHNELGNCIGYQVQIGDRTFYGEGSTAKIAKGLAAKDALTYIKVYFVPLFFVHLLKGLDHIMT